MIGGCPLKGRQVPVMGASGAHYRGVRYSVKGRQVPNKGASGAHYTGVRCPL